MSFEIKNSGLRLNLDKATNEAVFATAEQALGTCNKYCKFDTGALIFSSVIHTTLEGTVNTGGIPPEKLEQAMLSPGSDLENGILRWVMPYAEKQYAYPGAHPDKNAQATSHWCERAYENHHDEWERVFANAMNRGL